ncbi:MAG TPA: ABC transporter permease [Armatimonadota bacterium]|nr:ABC transporter permease [Armatimonadota bacterium]
MADLELIRSTLRLATPLILAAMGGILSERSGVVNIALEGMMLAGAFFGMLGSYWTGNPWIGVTLGMAAGGLLGLIHAALTQRTKLNHIVSGVALNIFALGLTTYLLRRVFTHAGSSPPVNGLQNWSLGLGRIPVVDQVIGDQNPLFYLAVVIVIGLGFMLFRTPIGLRLRSAGENPEAARSAGIRVGMARYLAVTASGVLGGLAGAYLSLGQLNMFAEGMSGGRGFIALAAVIFGKWNPYGAAGAALFFGFFDALQMRLQGQAILGITIPSEFMLMLPYVLTIIALAGFVGKAVAPAALGKED